jgi:uncharacterized protein with HEPN domain
MQLNEGARNRLWHVAAACRTIQGWTREKDLNDYLASPIVRAAVERQFILIGEALRQAVDLDGAIHAHVTDVLSIVNFRNFLVHNYSKIDDQVVWASVREDLPLLLAECRSLLGELPA